MPDYQLAKPILTQESAFSALTAEVDLVDVMYQLAFLGVGQGVLVNLNCLWLDWYIPSGTAGMATD